MYGAGVVVEKVARYLQVVLSCSLLEGPRFEVRVHWYVAYRVILLPRLSCCSHVACVAKSVEDRRDTYARPGHACKSGGTLASSSSLQYEKEAVERMLSYR